MSEAARTFDDLLDEPYLYRAIINDAISILRNPYMRDAGRRPSLRKAAVRWNVEREWVLDDSDGDNPFGFERCCTMLGIDPDAVRWQLRRSGLLDPDETGMPKRWVA